MKKTLAMLLIVTMISACGASAKALGQRPSAMFSAQEQPAPVGVIELRGEVNEEMAKDIIGKIKDANDEDVKKIVIRIHSGGGSVPDGFDIAQAIEDSKAPVTCVVDGEAASMAAYILESCSVRVMTKRSTLMFHEPALGGRMYGQPTYFQSIADWLKAMTDAMIEHCRARMIGVSFEFFKDKVRGGAMWWMAWRDAEKYGAVDKVVDSWRDAL